MIYMVVCLLYRMCTGVPAASKNLDVQRWNFAVIYKVVFWFYRMYTGVLATSMYLDVQCWNVAVIYEVVCFLYRMCTGVPPTSMYIGTKETICHLVADRRQDCCLRWDQVRARSFILFYVVWMQPALWWEESGQYSGKKTMAIRRLLEDLFTYDSKQNRSCAGLELTVTLNCSSAPIDWGLRFIGFVYEYCTYYFGWVSLCRQSSQSRP